MVEIIEKLGPFKIIRIWFHYENRPDCTLLRLMRQNSSVNSRWAVNEKSYTVMSDLSIEEESILNASRKTVRNEIHRAQNDGLEISFYNAEKFRNNIDLVDEFEAAYYRFAEELNNDVVTKAYNRKKIDQYIRNKCFMLTEAKRENLAVYHAYVYDEKEAVLIYSVSDFRDESIDKNLAGRANKYLHYCDMLMFKRHLLKNYDWGNISDPDNLNGIDNFKLSFGGKMTEKYNVLIGCNFVGKLFIWLYRNRRMMVEGKNKG